MVKECAADRKICSTMAAVDREITNHTSPRLIASAGTFINLGSRRLVHNFQDFYFPITPWRIISLVSRSPPKICQGVMENKKP